MRATVNEDTFLTIAEVAVAFAGFASVASAIGRGSSRVDPRIDAVRLHNMVEISLAVVACGFAPVWLEQTGLDDRMIWMLAGAFAGIAGVMTLVRANRRARLVEALPGYYQAGATRVRAIGATGISGMIIVATGLAHPYGETLYLGALLATLATAGMLFMRVIESLIYPGDATPGSPQAED
jgi:hypothetical protein